MYRAMTMFKQNRRISAWLACLAILLNALAPTISHAMAKAQGDDTPWAQICSTNGARLIPLDLGSLSADTSTSSRQDGEPQQSSMAMDHCAYCLTHAGSFAVFTDTPLPAFSTMVSQDYPARFYQSPHRLFVWATASPRAPPVLS
jgi:hypothetical protein